MEQKRDVPSIYQDILIYYGLCMYEWREISCVGLAPFLGTFHDKQKSKLTVKLRNSNCSNGHEKSGKC